MTTDTYSKTHKVLLRKNSVCYDKDIFGELLFWKDNKCDELSNFDFQKLKFSSSSIEEEPNDLHAYMSLMIGLDSQR